MGDLLVYERRLWAKGIRYVAGVDEAGRGPLAGPVVAVAVVLPEDVHLPGLKDSKRLNPGKREDFFDEIKRCAVDIGVGIVGERRIDRINILRATQEAMRMALGRVQVPVEYVFVDGCRLPGCPFPQMALVDGDACSLSVAAASVVAKVTRDRIMIAYDKRSPHYGFARHKGYGTAEHIAAIRKYGPCKIHRKTFGIVKEFVSSRNEDNCYAG